MLTHLSQLAIILLKKSSISESLSASSSSASATDEGVTTSLNKVDVRLSMKRCQKSDQCHLGLDRSRSHKKNSGAVAVGGGGKGQAKKGNRFGGGVLWETFVEEYSDMIDTEKYAQKVEAKRQKRAAKKTKGGALGGGGVEGFVAAAVGSNAGVSVPVRA